MKLIILIGRSCTGKTTLVYEMKQKYDIYEALSFTTRSKRPNEVDGIDYSFITVEEFNKLKQNNQLIDYVEYYDNYYGLSETSFNFTKDNVVIVEPTGIERIKQNLKDRFDIITVQLDAPDEIILDRFKKRGDDSEIAKKRFEKDKIIFSNVNADIYVKYPKKLDYDSILKKN